MPAAPETTMNGAENGAENGALTKTQKLAALLVMLGPESAAELLKGFQPAEIETISRDMSRFNLISREQQEEILEEFSAVAVEASTSIAAGVAFRVVASPTFVSFTSTPSISAAPFTTV